MIVLDTNVLSELIRPQPDGGVAKWAAARPSSTLYTTAVTQAELLRGVAVLPDGRRKSALHARIAAMFEEDFAERVLPFDSSAAASYAEIAARRSALGRPISQFDAQIAAIARSRGAALATRNAKDFDECGVDVINPWEVGSSRS